MQAPASSGSLYREAHSVETRITDDVLRATDADIGNLGRCLRVVWRRDTTLKGLALTSDVLQVLPGSWYSANIPEG